MSRPPAFWFTDPDTPDWRARALAPLACVWTLVTAKRLRPGHGRRLGPPVICVGNLTVGGAGKTPTVIALAERLAGFGLAAHVVTRGYGGRSKGPLRVDPCHHTAAQVGDEALLLAQNAPVWVARNRSAGARAAAAVGAQTILLDDGFQNPAVAKDLSILVVDAETGFGNGRVVPAGPLREPIAAGLDRADLLLSIGPRAAQTRFRARWPLPPRLARIAARLAPRGAHDAWRGLRVYAFAGIGRPEKFFATLEELGAALVGCVALTDHRPLGPALMRRLRQEAARHGAHLVTTEKDAVRLPPACRDEILILGVRFAPESWTQIDAALARIGIAAG